MPSRVLTLFTVLLCTFASVLAWESTRQFDRTSQEVVWSGDRQLVRSYYSNLNAYLSTGEIEPLSSMFAVDPKSGARPGCGRFEMETRWRALKATFPDLSVWIRNQGLMGKESIVDLDLETSGAVIPDWLHLRHNETPREAVEWFGISETEIADFRSTMQPSLALEFTDPNQAMHVNRDSSLAIVRLELAADQRTFERLPGPGSLLVTSGELELVANPTHFVTLVRDTSSDTADPIQILRPGDAATAARGDLVVRNSGRSPVSAFYVFLQPQSSSDEIAPEPGHGLFERSVLAEGRSSDPALAGDAGTVPSVSATLVGSGVDAHPGWGELRVAIVLSDRQLGAMPVVAIAPIRGPLDIAGGCGEGRSMYLAAAYIPTS